MLTPTRYLRAQWSSTLHLPKSAFPARPSPTSTASYLRRCTDELYSWQENARSTPNPREQSLAETFILHDGPPYANGPLHIGHALNKITKDLICRFQIGQGKKVNYVPGWDCHGLPIEIKALQAQKQYEGDRTAIARQSAVSVREAARELATRTIGEQMKGFREWAVIGDWNNAYRTMEKGFELRQLNVFKQMVEKGLIYRQYKPVYWSPSSATALAEAELEYDENHKSLAAFVKFPVTASESFQSSYPALSSGLHAVTWTTTPWTLPANKAIAVHNDMEYVIVKDPRQTSEQLLVATSRVPHLESMLNCKLEVVDTRLLGLQLAANLHYKNPLQGSQGKLQPIIHADFVTDSSGSGLVHIAPGHGMDDYNVCSALHISAFAPVNDQGSFTEAAFPDDPTLLEGLSVQDQGVSAVLDFLKAKNTVLATHTITHKYPIDWRTKKPVIVRATEQWFTNVEGIKDEAMQAIQNVTFIPETGKPRLESFIQGRSQWCISRQRAWGVPIPALYRIDRGNREATMDGPIIEHIIEMVQQRGIDAWWTDPEDDPAWVPKHLEGTYVRGKDTMDVWFDSGTSWALLPARKDEPVADVYLEGTDQHRGWFQSSLLTHVAQQTQAKKLPSDRNSHAHNKAPFKTLITHGFTLDQEGRKMSKSLGNVISPDQIMSGTLLPPLTFKKKGKKAAQNQEQGPIYDAMGADALRLWVASSDYTKDVTIGQPVLQAVNNALHKYRVTFKWLLGVLALHPLPRPEFHTLRNELQASKPTLLIDQIALRRLSHLAHEVHTHYSGYEFFRGVAALNKYIAHDLSAFYFETLKDRIYAGATEDRESARRMLTLIFYEMSQMLAPVCPLLVEEAWDHVPETMRREEFHPARTTWTPFTYALSEKEAEVLDQKTDLLNAIHASIKLAQERARSEKKMGSGLECEVIIATPPRLEGVAAELLNDNMANELAAVFVVSGVRIVRDEHEAVENLVPAWSFEESVVSPGLERGFTNTHNNSLKVRVIAPSQHKCDRCWRFVAPEPASLCVRCEEVVKEEGTAV